MVAVAAAPRAPGAQRDLRETAVGLTLPSIADAIRLGNETCGGKWSSWERVRQGC